MAIIPQTTMFLWEEEMKNLGDLERLALALENMPDEGLMRGLEAERRHGRDDYPVRAMWNALTAMFVLGRQHVAGLIRELGRNPQLRRLLGFKPGRPPTAAAFSRFMAKLEGRQDEITAIFLALHAELSELLPGFGKDVALDSKSIWSMANGKSGGKNTDRRTETDAEWGVKEYRGRREDGTEWSRKETCFGFKLHLIADATHGLPIAFSVSPASGSDVACGKELLESLAEGRPEVLEACSHLMADRGYDDTAMIRLLMKNGVKAVIDKRDMWRTEGEKEVPGHKGIYYNEHGEVFCYSPEKGERHEMRPAGYDAQRGCLRVKCPALLYGATCAEAGTCGHCKNVRIPLETDMRVFTEVARPSCKWESLYKKRTAVERVFSRMDVSLGFEGKRLRGLARMELMCSLALAAMNAMAVGRIKGGRPKLMRSLVKAA